MTDYPMPPTPNSQPPAPNSQPPAQWKQQLRRRLLAWYRRAARELPWRADRDLYRIWVSEIMLQQTQVATVEAYFDRFLRAFPTARALAAADQDEVLRLWEGLGYYRRARQLHAAAKLIADRFGGAFPTSAANVLSLPGVGRYTAGAILSIGLDAREPILEANTIRLYCRLLAFDGATTTAAGQKLLWSFAENILPRRRCGTFNQALMELGSLICTPKTPKCETCPLAQLCPTNVHGWQDSIPRPKAAKQFESIREAAIVVRRRGRIVLRRCGEGERWAGLWDFPRFSITSNDEAESAVVHTEIADKVRRMTGLTIRTAEHLTTIKHGVTRYRISLDCYQAQCQTGRLLRNNGEQIKWVDPAQLDSFPLCVTGRKLSRLLLPT